nr:MAG: hypothetical protein DIU62_13250 [Pseudomonadota bacterium]
MPLLRVDQATTTSRKRALEREDPDTRTRALPRLAIVVPCHNEEEVLPGTARTLLARLNSLREEGLVAPSSSLCLVDDGSTDRTWALIRELHATEPRVQGLKLTRNFGHQAALLAGMFEVDADAVVTIDADLQDDETCITEMVRQFRAGHDLVLGVRDDRRSDTTVKRATAHGYYRLLRLLGVNVAFNHAASRRMSSPAAAEPRQSP